MIPLHVLLLSIPVFILLVWFKLSFLLRLLPFVFLSTFGASGVIAIIDSLNQKSAFRWLELSIGILLILFASINLYLVISNQLSETAILKSRLRKNFIKNIVTEKIEKPKFDNPHQSHKQKNDKLIDKNLTSKNLTSKNLTGKSLTGKKQGLHQQVKNKLKSMKSKSPNSKSNQLPSLPRKRKAQF